MPRAERTATRADMIAFGAIALAILLAWARVRTNLVREMNWDATHVYLPMARRLLDEGLAFFSRPESVHMPPLAYAWPALLGAGDTFVRTFNAALFPAIVALAAAAAWPRSRRAAVIAAWALACSPLLPRWMADAMTEAPFLLFVALWMVAIARIAAGGGTRWVALAATWFALACLTRPAASLFAPVAAAVFAVMAWRARTSPERDIDRRLAWAHAFATLGWLAWLLHNAWQFHFPAIASGAGTALWHGLNPLTNGFDPHYFGLAYDEGSVARDIDHLDMAADRILGRAASLQLHELSLPALATLVAQKACALLFLTPYETSLGPLAGARAWRVLLLVLGVIAVLRRPRSRLVRVVAGYVLYTWATYLPMLFTLRYSVGALDLPLTLLAALGAVECTTIAWAAGAGFVTIIGVALGLPGMAERVPGPPLIEHAHLQTLWERDAGGLDTLHIENARRTGSHAFVLEPGAAIELEVRDAPGLNPAISTLASFDIALAPGPEGAPCDALRVRFRPSGHATFDPDRSVRVLLRADGVGRAYTLGTTDPLQLVRDGTLRLEFDCRVAARAEIGTIRVYASSRGLHFYDLMHAASAHARGK